ncbi:hypothetical protein AGMMS49546_34740 [Spirochaetia bacterium]|nr:hypothetical protein AGMMS49546_34740 [Spirochaetia bacterium]
MRSRSLTTLIIGLGFIAVAVIGFVFYVQFRGLTREYSTFTRESYTTYIDSLNKNTIASMAAYIEQEFPILHDTEKLKREAGTDWFWEQSGKLTRIAKTFGFAYIYYIEKAENGYIFLMSSGIGRDEHPEWLGGPVWAGPTPAFIDEAWKTGKLTFSPEPTVNEWGSLISAELPIQNDGAVVGILGVDYEVSSLMQTLRQNEMGLNKRGEALLNKMLIVLIVSLVVIMAIMGVQMAVNRTMIMIPAQVMEANERTQIMLDAMPMACSIRDENGAILECNAAAFKILGLSQKSDYIEHFYDMNPEYQPDGMNTREKVAALAKKAFETGYECVEWMCRTASGEPLPLETTVVRVPWKGGFQLVVYSRDLREIRGKEDAAREANERIRLMMDATPMVCSIWDASGAMLDCNLEALKMLGLSQKSDYIGHFFDLNPEYQPDGTSSREKAAALIKAAFETGYQRFEWMYLTAQGQELPVETTLVRVPWKGGFQLAAYSRDLREIKAKEEAARESEERVNLMLDNMTFACCIYDDYGNIYDCNRRMVELLGCKDKQEVTVSIARFFPEYQSNGKLSMAQALVEGQKAIEDGKNTFFWEHIKLDGSPLPVEITLRRVKWRGGYAIISCIRDLSDLMESEDNLKRILSIVESSPNLILYTGAGGDIGYMNPALSTVTLFSDEDLLKGGLSLIFSPEDFERIEQEYFPTVLQGRMVNFETGVNDKNGGYRDFSFSAFAVDLHGGKTGIGLLGQDITELKQMQRNLMVATEQAKAALAQEVQLNRAKSDFLSRVSHELRTPLNTITGMTIIAEKKGSGKDQEYCFEKIKESSEHLLGMVNDILDMAGFDTGRFDFLPLPFSFTAAMRSVIDTITPKAKAKEQAFSTDIDGNIHDSLLSDERRLTQVLVKLLSNAVKFTMEKGRISLSARLLESREDDCLVRFEVSDNGIGIDKEAQQRLWGIFEQEDNSITRKFGGMGIGLSLTKRIVKLLGGEIRVESEPGKGSRFICDIRLGIDRSAVEPGKDDVQETETDTGIGAHGDFTGRWILIVDDVEINREILSAMLESTGAILEEAQDGEEAVRLFSQNKYDLVLMDLHMPVMDGFSATKEIRASALPWAKTTPVISVSAESNAELHSKCLDAGISDHLAKPIETEALFAMITKWLPR